MATLKNTNKKCYNITPNIIMNIDDNNMGEMYVYGDSYGYILNGATASDLVDYFAYKNNIELSEEILDMLMSINLNMGTH
jgi:type I restriction-modification system DNA methylase subunit